MLAFDIRGGSPCQIIMGFRPDARRRSSCGNIILMSERKRARLFISGLVQGVFFRDHTQRWASSLGLTGWVRNLDDGRVEALAEGPEADLQAFISKLHQGPPQARVEDVAVEWEPHRGEFNDFRILRTW
jgi:acylphosphatase